MKKFVDDGMFLQMEITLIICQKKNTSTTRNKWWLHLNKSDSATLPLRKRSDFKQALSTLERFNQKDGGAQFAPTPFWKNKEVGIEFVLYMVEMQRILVVFRKNQKAKEKASKVLEKNGENRCYQDLGKILRRWLSRIQFVFTDRSFTADSGLL